MDTSVLFKYRSVTACMKASYDLISNQLTSLLKKTWWAVGIYAFLMALTIYFRLPDKAMHDWGESNPWSSYIIQTVIYLGVWLASFVYGAAIWTWFNKRSFKTNLIRFGVVGLILEIIIMLIAGESSIIQSLIQEYTAPAAQAASTMALGAGSPAAVGAAQATAAQAMADSTSVAAAQAANGGGLTTGVAISCIVGLFNLIIFLLLTVPFNHIIPNMMLKEKGEKWSLWQSFKTGFRHFGNLFKMGFLGFIMVGIICFALFIPTFIICWGQIASQLGALNGDPLGVPGYFPLMIIVVLTLTIFIASYVMVWLQLAFAYLYGSHKAQEEEKQLRIKNL